MLILKNKIIFLIVIADIGTPSQDYSLVSVEYVYCFVPLWTSTYVPVNIWCFLMKKHLLLKVHLVSSYFSPENIWVMDLQWHLVGDQGMSISDWNEFQGQLPGPLSIMHLPNVPFLWQFSSTGIWLLWGKSKDSFVVTLWWHENACWSHYINQNDWDYSRYSRCLIQVPPF